MNRRRRPQAPPPPRPQSATDPIAPTTTEWRETERAKAAARREWAKRVALVLTLPLLAGGPWAFPLVYAWVFLCRAWPLLRPWGVLLALPALAGVGLRWETVLGPTRALVTLPLRAGALERTVPFWFPELYLERTPGAPVGQIAVQAGGVRLVPALGPDPLPLLWEVLRGAWPTGLVFAGALCAAWGMAGLLEGRRLKSRTPGGILRSAKKKTEQAGGALDVVEGMVLRGYITLLFGPSGAGKTELALAMIAASLRVEDGRAKVAAFCGRTIRRARWYYAIEQIDENFAPYLTAWGLTDAVAQGRLKIVTASEVMALWRAHGHDAVPDWMDVAPLMLDDAGSWGADVFVLDTLLDWSGAQDNPTIRRHMGPIRAAVVAHRYAFLALSHTNERGTLLGGKAFFKLCDVVLKMELPWGKYDPRRVVVFDKDRTRGTVPQLTIRREIDAEPPTFRLDDTGEPPAPATAPKPAAKPRVRPANVIDLAAKRPGGAAARGGVGGVFQGKTAEKNAEKNESSPRADPDEARLEAAIRAAAGGTISTVELQRVTGFDVQKTHRVLRKLRARGVVEQAGKDGKAATWRVVIGGATEAKG